jgi:tRNA pseudouridine38-40 synthase
MVQASRYFVGTHDFKAFEGSGSPGITQCECHHGTTICGSGGKITFDIEANGFLRFMVRNIVGTLVDVGMGKLSMEDIPEIFHSRDRSRASATAPAQGLFLISVNLPLKPFTRNFSVSTCMKIRMIFDSDSIPVIRKQGCVIGF